MELSTWLAISAVLAGFFGIMLLAWPEKMTGQFGMKSNEVSVVLSRSMGVALVVVAVINWAARNYAGSLLVWSIVGANIILHAGTGLIDLRATQTKLYNRNGWGSVVMHAAAGAIFAYYLVFTR